MGALQIQRLPVKAILTTIVALQVIAIATSMYSLAFDDYITIVLILLAFPLAFFAYHYLRNAYREAKDEERFSKVAYRKVPSQVGNQTDEEVRKLVESAAYQEYEKRKARRAGEEDSSEQKEDQTNQDLDQILAELQEKQTEIFQN